jgi:alkylhydroperoxidase family enzyme
VKALTTGFGPEFVESVRRGERPCPNVIGTLATHPTIAGPWFRWNNVLFRQLALDKRLTELAILRVAARTGAKYEWAQHARMAARVGIPDDAIDAVGDGTAGPYAWTALEAAVLDATDELVRDHVISDATWARLSEHLDDRVITELIFVVGSYTCLAMAFNSFGLQLDDDLVGTVRPFPEQ